MARLSEWAVLGYPRQADFYREQVADFRRRDQKVVVIISDALHYEVSAECLREFRKLRAAVRLILRSACRYELVQRSLPQPKSLQ